MKKIMMMIAAVVLVLAMAVPAVADDLSISNSTYQSGDNSNQCSSALQFGNTGDVANFQGFAQYNSSADDVAFNGSGFYFAPEQGTLCGQVVDQDAVAVG